VSIMTRPRVKELLEKWIQGALTHLIMLLTLYRRRVRAAWRALQGLEAHHGAALLLVGEDSLRFQWRLAVALGDTERALIVQKFDEWIKRNRKEGRPATTYNGYADWVRDHFGHLSEDQFGRHVRALETLGVLITQRVGRRDQRKEYRIDHRRLNILVAAIKTADSSMKTRYSNMQMPSSRLNNDSKSPNPKSVPNALPQEEPTKPGRGGRRAGAGRKAKSKEALTEQPQPPDASNLAGMVGQSNATGDSDFASPSPHSAAPSPHPEAELIPAVKFLIERMAALDLDEGKAAALIAHYGANRVRAVAHRCEQRLKPDSREQRIERPAGWIVAELKNDVFKLGEMAATEQNPDSDSHALNGDAEREERMRRETERLLAEEGAQL
jgi:hypothetical protein